MASGELSQTNNFSAVQDMGENTRTERGSDPSTCGCECGDPNADMVSLAAEHDDFPLQCTCRSCGPGGPTERRCQIRVDLVRAWWTNHRRGWPIPEAGASRFLAERPVFCGHCIDHGLLELRKAAVLRARQKRAQERSRIRGLPTRTAFSSTKSQSH